MLAPQVSQVGNAALIERETVTLPLDHAFGFELADVGPAAIEMQRQFRRADDRGLGRSPSRYSRLGDGRAVNGDGRSHRVRSCSDPVGYSDCSVSVKAVSTAAPMYFRIRRHSGHSRTCRWLNPVANDHAGHCSSVPNIGIVECSYGR